MSVFYELEVLLKKS